jgi:hypothetical protein
MIADVVIAPMAVTILIDAYLLYILSVGCAAGPTTSCASD